jgi:DNA-binding IclR family transcriptional regulator
MAGAATVGKALDLLFHLHEAGTPLGPSEIGRELDLPRSSCHRLLVALAERDVVERDEVGRYRPGLALLSLGLGVQGREPVVRAARPILEEEAAELGETVFLVGRRRASLRVLDKSEGSGFLRVAPGVGDVIPPDVTAAGKLFRVFAPATVLAVKSDIEPPSEARAAGASSEDLEIHRLGYATNRDAWIDGLSVLAVPIWQGGPAAPRELAATLALGAASRRFDSIGEERIAGRLLAAAARVGERLGPGLASTRNRTGAAKAPGRDGERR